MPSPESNQSPQQEGWSRPKPEVLAKPTWWPAALALGATLFVWGLVTSFIILAIGLAASAISLAGWIGDIRHEHKEH
jgi:hypothetical protein